MCGHDAAVGYRVRLEGGLVSACEACSGSGEIVSKVSVGAVKPKRKPEAPKTADVIVDDVPESKARLEFDLVDDYGIKVKNAREKRDWTQDDLGKLVNETHSMIHRIELGKLEPTAHLARKLESKLGIRILSAHTEEVEPSKAKVAEKDLTLGDMIVMRKRTR